MMAAPQNAVSPSRNGVLFWFFGGNACFFNCFEISRNFYALSLRGEVFVVSSCLGFERAFEIARAVEELGVCKGRLSRSARVPHFRCPLYFLQIMDF